MIGKIIWSTLIVDLFGSLLLGVYGIIKESAPEMFFYVFTMLIGSLFIPTFLAVCIYQGIKRKVVFVSNTKTFIARSLTMGALFCIGMSLWNLVIVLLDGKVFEGENFIDNFIGQFYSFMLIGLAMAIVTPLADVLVARRYATRK